MSSIRMNMASGSGNKSDYENKLAYIRKAYTITAFGVLYSSSCNGDIDFDNIISYNKTGDGITKITSRLVVLTYL